MTPIAPPNVAEPVAGEDRDEVAARLLVLGGRVQGVGFRPFVHRLATQLRLKGDVRNLSGQVVIHVEGDASALAAFLPYSPLHHLLLDDFGQPIVATSGNVSGEPVITSRDVQALVAQGDAIGNVEHFDAVGLTGGVFQNRQLVETVISRLQGRRLRVELPSLTPINDGGLAFGQIVEAAARRTARSAMEQPK